jgi:hypothetical protein
MGGPDPRIVYQVDKGDRICDVNAAWSAFASANQGAHLLPPAVLGQSLWDAITDPTTRLVYRALLARVRSGAGPVRFLVRCDAPDRRRLLEMRIMTTDTGGVAFSSAVVAEEPRPRVSLLDVDARRSAEILPACGWCMRVRLADGSWVEIEEAVSALALFESEVLPQLSHGMCPSCYDAMDRALGADERSGAERIDLGVSLPKE